MNKIFFKIAFRNCKNHSTQSILNISGMAIGMTCAILILLWVYNEWSYDRHFEHANDLYRVIEKQKLPGGEVSLFAPTLSAVAPALKNEYPEVIRSSRVIHTPLTLKKGDEFIEETVVAVDKDFLKMFSVKFIQGDINTALNDPHNIIITENTAHKYFGNNDALGKTLLSRGYEVTVSGVVKSFPSNSHLQFNFLVPILWFAESGANMNDWNDPGRSYSYIELKKGTDNKLFDNKINDFIKTHKKGSDAEIFLQNIKDIHLYSSGKYNYDSSGNGDITYVIILGIIAILILLVACINFMNLSTAQSVQRAREIGVRKVTGANKFKIMVQFIGESLLILLVSLVIAIVLVELLLPGFNNLTGKQLDVNFNRLGIYVSLITVIIFCSLLAGSYPAFYLSSVEPLDCIKGVFNKNPGKAKYRRSLVIFQFSLSVILIICTLTIRNQISYIQNKKLGYNKENIGYFMFPIRPGDPKLDALKKELCKSQDIVSVTKGNSPLNLDFTSGNYQWPGKKVGDDVLFHHLDTDEDYAKTFQLELKSGRFFSSEFSTDNTSVVINEKAAEAMGLQDPVGETLTAPWGAKFTIIGVLKDFHIQSLHHKIEPLLMQKGESNFLYVKMKPEHIPTTIEFINQTFKSFNPGLPMDFHFLDDDFDNLYQGEKRMSKIFACFSLLAIFISCLGLIGLSLFIAELRIKEVGVRKVNGAKSFQIFSLLSKEYMVWVSVSILIATPIGWLSMHKWLDGFAYKTTLSWWIFALAGLLAFGIALLTVSLQSWRAATRNPVEALRYE
jgi:putative ABC transport system permease protein